MSNHFDVVAQARPLTLQAAVFRALRDRGMEPQLSDTSGRVVPPAATFEEQMARIMLAAQVAADLRGSIGLNRSERAWANTVVDATCRRHEQRRQASSRPAAQVAAQVDNLVSAGTATATAVVFRRRIGGGHG